MNCIQPIYVDVMSQHDQLFVGWALVPCRTVVTKSRDSSLRTELWEWHSGWHVQEWLAILGLALTGVCRRKFETEVVGTDGNVEAVQYHTPTGLFHVRMSADKKRANNFL